MVCAALEAAAPAAASDDGSRINTVSSLLISSIFLLPFSHSLLRRLSARTVCSLSLTLSLVLSQPGGGHWRRSSPQSGSSQWSYSSGLHVHSSLREYFSSVRTRGLLLLYETAPLHPTYLLCPASFVSRVPASHHRCV